MSYDQRCYDIAFDVLCDKGIPDKNLVKECDKLAQEIQFFVDDAVEEIELRLRGKAE